MNLLQARKELLINAKAGNATLFVSDSGIGKSDLCEQVFEQLKAEGALRGERWGMCKIFLATQSPADILGLQFKGERKVPQPDGTTRTVTVSDPAVPMWMLTTEGLPAFMYDKIFLLIDEYGQGEPDTKRAAAELLLKGGSPPFYLPEGSVRVACSNEGIRHGVTKDFDFAIARRTELKIQFNINVWLEYADKPYKWQGRMWQTLPVIKFWAAQHGSEVMSAGAPKDKQGAWCNPRTLCSFDRNLQERMALNGGTLDPSDTLMIEVGEGTVGMPATQSIIGSLQSQLELPSYQDVISDPDNCPVPIRPDLLMLMAFQLAGWAKVEDLAACIKYIQRMGRKDMAITFISSLLRRDYKSVINQKPMKEWIGKNSALVAICQSLSQ